jgi:multicomponent Na+:H+ antiporter subunit E
MNRLRIIRVVALFAALLAFWLLLSGRLDPLFLVIGVASAAAVTWFASRLLDGVLGPADRTPRVSLWHLTTFFVWLLAQIPPAGLVIARVVIDQGRPPRPGVARFTTRLQSPAARTLLANAITLVPGTMTLNVEGDELTVHAFTPDAMYDLYTAATQRRIARAFREPLDDPPELIWEPIHDELPEVLWEPDDEVAGEGRP